MIMRRLLLFLSGHQRLRRWVETSPAARRVTARFIAGQRLEDAVSVCQRLNAAGMLVTLDHLGEHVTSAAEAAASREAYLQALERICMLGLRASISIKLSQFGLDISEALCNQEVEAVVRQAAHLGISVEVDMESREYVDRTLRLVLRMHQRYANVRGVIQAYLRRSLRDLEMLCEHGVPVRLCKGAYSEPASVAYTGRRQIRQNFLALMRLLMDRGVNPGFATHDELIVNEILRYARLKKIACDGYEFQMLYGIRRDLQSRLLAAGCRLRIYVPYGEAWYPYFMRRMAEHPQNFWLVLGALLRG